ncbi:MULTISPECIES: MotA/TolQ/ExbB proton channel family protein [unclassified Myxococcus]|uniref:MotA/TolQ/ExbB proton channel family protein n=1 Tax=unclassified Myxococcus TaxID=2648731 RepID=UPI001CBBC942|nr:MULTISPECIES: MotA/TolQ/ExbB proton channel family protein [unclassified Myxococcus]MBZ4402285.1 MotA/TolQ/ExbB proton channel family protein [Myxococcus sp. AS-1-15]MBZ4411211.1 MotA/TolQ/ExbB proton channel family protein [Myxococcus sp. XM-1-1-1]
MHIVEIVKDVFIHWGANWVLWLLFALSLVSLGIILERWWLFRTKQDRVRELSGALEATLSTGDFPAAISKLEKRTSVGATVARAGLRLAPQGMTAAEKGMQSALAIERSTLENRLAFLGTLGNNAPFIGLFGTVIGVLLAFEALSKTQGAPSGTSQVASNAVMGSIAEALVATAVGIGVALPAVAAYNYFQRRIASILADAEALTNLVLAYVSARERNGGA